MSGILSALNSGKTSLETNQINLEVTGNNISNVHTEGYSRQEVNLGDIPAFSMKGFFVGKGVRADTVSREHDQFLETQLVRKGSEYGYQNARTNTFERLQQVFPVSDNNISTSIDNFFDSAQALTNNPGDLVARNTLLQKGQDLSRKIVNTSQEMAGLQRDLDISVQSGIEEINSKIKTIADLNTTIQVIETTGQTANGQRDQQESLIRDLSKSIGAQSYTAGNGMVSLFLPGGLPLVQGTSAMSISAEENAGMLELKLNISGDQKELTADRVGGSIKGYLELRDEVLPGYMDRLDHLAFTITEEVNNQHRMGRDLNGDPGENFFREVPNKGNVLNADAPEWAGAAAAMAVVITDTSKVAAGKSSAPGDNENMLAIADLNGKKVDGNETFTSLISTITSDIGSQSARQQLALSSAEDSMTQLTNMKESLTGVSLEEEMINLMKYQRSFQSSAKFLSTVDEMMETLISLK